VALGGLSSPVPSKESHQCRGLILLHWRTAFYVLPICIHNKVAVHLITRALADDDPRPSAALS
jgi:hypothetical protein